MGRCVNDFVLATGALALSLLFCFRQVRKQKRLSTDRADIRVDTDGICFNNGHQDGIQWTNVEKVTLEWDENPWGDPMFGPYCDTDWVLWGRDQTVRIWQSSGELNNEVLVPAMQRYLPEFQFNLRDFERKHGNRLFDLKGGSVVVWERRCKSQ